MSWMPSIFLCKLTVSLAISIFLSHLALGHSLARSVSVSFSLSFSRSHTHCLFYFVLFCFGTLHAFGKMFAFLIANCCEAIQIVNEENFYGMMCFSAVTLLILSLHTAASKGWMNGCFDAFVWQQNARHNT